jgi:hypothetical protein
LEQPVASITGEVMRVYMAIANAGTLIAMLITPTDLVVPGTLPVVAGRGLVYLAVGLVWQVARVETGC